MKLHPRTQIVQKAQSEIGKAILSAVEKHDLTPIEIVRIALDEAASWSKYVLRAERHPEDPDKRADEE